MQPSQLVNLVHMFPSSPPKQHTDNCAIMRLSSESLRCTCWVVGSGKVCTVRQAQSSFIVPQENLGSSQVCIHKARMLSSVYLLNRGMHKLPAVIRMILLHWTVAQPASQTRLDLHAANTLCGMNAISHMPAWSRSSTTLQLPRYCIRPSEIIAMWQLRQF